MDDALGLTIDHLDEQFDRGLEAAGNTRGRTLCSRAQNEDDDEAGQEREEDRVEVDVRDIEQSVLSGRRQVMEVVDDILRCS